MYKHRSRFATLVYIFQIHKKYDHTCKSCMCFGMDIGCHTMQERRQLAECFLRTVDISGRPTPNSFSQKDPCKREKALSCANNNVVNCPCAVKTCSVSSKMLTGSSKDPNLIFQIIFLRAHFFDHFPFFSAREIAFFVTAARN